MGRHIPVVEEGWSFDCIEGDCEHETDDECVQPVVACAGCLEDLDPEVADDDGLYTIPEWPCVQATHYGEPATRDLKASLVGEWRSKRHELKEQAS